MKRHLWPFLLFAALMICPATLSASLTDKQKGPPLVRIQWEQSMYKGDFGGLKGLYAPRVLYYGKQCTRDQVVRDKKNLLAQGPWRPKYAQPALQEGRIAPLPEAPEDVPAALIGKYQAVYAELAPEVPGGSPPGIRHRYLVLAQMPDGWWRIIEESLGLGYPMQDWPKADSGMARTPLPERPSSP